MIYAMPPRVPLYKKPISADLFARGSLKLFSGTRAFIAEMAAEADLLAEQAQVISL